MRRCVKSTCRGGGGGGARREIKSGLQGELEGWVGTG